MTGEAVRVFLGGFDSHRHQTKRKAFSYGSFDYFFDFLCYSFFYSFWLLTGGLISDLSRDGVTAACEPLNLKISVRFRFPQPLKE